MARHTPAHSPSVDPDQVIRYARSLARLFHYVDHDEAVGAAVVAFYEATPAPDGVSPLTWARRGMVLAIRKLYRPESPSLAVEWMPDTPAPDGPPDVTPYLDALTVAQRAVVVRYFGLEGNVMQTQQQIADDAGVDQSAVAKTLARALARMHDLGQ